MKSTKPTKPTMYSVLLVLLALAVLGCDGHNRASATPAGPQTAAKVSEVNIIVRLKVPGIDEQTERAARLKDPQAVREALTRIERRIFAVADKVLQRIAHTPHRLVRRYSTLPLLALAVSPAAKSILETLPEVERISLDQPRGLAQPL